MLFICMHLLCTLQQIKTWKQIKHSLPVCCRFQCVFKAPALFSQPLAANIATILERQHQHFIVSLRTKETHLVDSADSTVKWNLFTHIQGGIVSINVFLWTFIWNVLQQKKSSQTFILGCIEQGCYRILINCLLLIQVQINKQTKKKE